MRHLFQIVGSFPTLTQRVAMHLRCGGIFNDCFIIQSLLRLRVKMFWKSINIWRRVGILFWR